MRALLTATEAEIYRTLKQLKNSQTVSWGHGRFSVGTLDGIPVVAGWTGTGTTLAAMSTQYVCDRWKPSMILFAGSAGALNPSFETGQAVVARGVYQWDLDALALGIERGVFPGERDHRNKALRMIPVDGELRQYLLDRGNEKILEGTFVSGNRFVDLSRPLPEELKGFHGDVVDIESIAPAMAGYINGIPVLLLRIIADTVSGGRPRNFRMFIDETSLRIANFFRLIPEKE